MGLTFTEVWLGVRRLLRVDLIPDGGPALPQYAVMLAVWTMPESGEQAPDPASSRDAASDPRESRQSRAPEGEWLVPVGAGLSDDTSIAIRESAPAVPIRPLVDATAGQHDVGLLLRPGYTPAPILVDVSLLPPGLYRLHAQAVVDSEVWFHRRPGHEGRTQDQEMMRKEQNWLEDEMARAEVVLASAAARLHALRQVTER